jgi:adenylate kinase family enzyme
MYLRSRHDEPPLGWIHKRRRRGISSWQGRADKSQPDERLFVRRVSIVGITGSGKTYLARRLSAHLGLPVIELDTLRENACASGNPSDDAFGDAIRAAVNGECWIIDGHYRAFRHSVWNKADLIIHLDYPLRVVLLQLMRRYLGNHARPRTTRPPSARASASWRKRFARLTKTAVERREYAKVLGELDNAEARVKRFASPQAALAWIESLEQAAARP